MKTLLIIFTNLALLSTLIFLIIFIVRAVKRQNKRQPGIITLISFLVLITVSIIGSQLYPTGLNPTEDKEARLTQNARNTKKSTERSGKFIEIDGFKLSLGEVSFNEKGFLEIKLNAEKQKQATTSFPPHCYSAVLTVEENDTPVYIENEREDISNLPSGYRLVFATNKTSVNLYIELGEWGKGKSRTWYHLDLKSKKCVMLEGGCPFETLSVFDKNKLTNAANSIKSNIRAFKPADPQSMHFIVYANPVINPLTKRVSTGGRTDTDRYLPVSTQDVINDNGNLKNTGGLILTDDPNRAAFVLILDLTYVDAGRTFTYSENNSKIKEYNAVNKFELYNLLSGESIKTEIKTYATYEGELASVTNSSKGKQMFAGTIGTRVAGRRPDGAFLVGTDKGLPATEFPGYVEFVRK